MDRALNGAATIVDGWRYTSATGGAGHDLALPAAFAKYQIGACVPGQLGYPATAVDADGEPFAGEHAYVLRMAKDPIPPVGVFWNLNLFEAEQFCFENDSGRYSIGTTTDGLRYDEDGSITIQIRRPADTSNRLPAPASGPFTLTMRLCGAQALILAGDYRLTAAERAA